MKSFDFDKLFEIEDSVNVSTNRISKNNTDEYIDLIYWMESEKKNLPYKELMKRGIIHSENINADIFKLLSNNIDTGSSTLYRAGNLKDSNLRNTLISTWQAVVEEKSKNEAMSIPEFSHGVIDQEFINGLVKLSVDPESIKKVKGILFGYGIIFIVEKAFDGLGIDGLVYKNRQGNPILAMSLRYDRYDNFWFTLCHELSHIALHYDLLDNAIIEDLDSLEENEIEDEANYYAGLSVINRRAWRSSNIIKNPSEANLYKISEEVGIHPAILAGRVRFQLKNYKLFNELIQSNRPSEILEL